MTRSDPEQNFPSPAVQAGRIRGELKSLVGQLRADLERVDDPRLRALVEVSAEMLEGIHRAFANFDEARRKVVPLSQ
jgi:hypothetical protein